MIPIRSKSGNDSTKKIPPIIVNCAIRPVILTVGTILERKVNQEYACACCTACPTSWAATAADEAFFLLIYYFA